MATAEEEEEAWPFACLLDWVGGWVRVKNRKTPVMAIHPAILHHFVETVNEKTIFAVVPCFLNLLCYFAAIHSCRS